jgi:hypothetical protein
LALRATRFGPPAKPPAINGMERYLCSRIGPAEIGRGSRITRRCAPRPPGIALRCPCCAQALGSHSIATRATHASHPAQSRRRSTWPSAKFRYTACQNLACFISQVRPEWQSMPNCDGAIFLKLVGATGFEPATLWSQTRCATRLRHAPSQPTATRRVGAVILSRFAWARRAVSHRAQQRRRLRRFPPHQRALAEQRGDQIDRNHRRSIA